MDAFPNPPSGPKDQVSGLSCPDCFGVLSVRVEGNGLHFTCRIGHSYSTHEVIEGKERLIEQYLWSAVTALDELAHLLREAGPEGASPEAFAERSRRALRQGETLRGVIAENTATTLDPDDAEEGDV
jgi:two-component system chemotaxis response regulator CheB